MSTSADWRGCVQVYTGNGKGKTTAALGLAMRAAGAGLPVFIGQFIKGMRYSEIKALEERFSDLIEVCQYGRGCFIRGKPDSKDIAAATAGLEQARQALISGKYRVFILDEANVAAYFGLFPVEHLLQLVEEKPENVELILTGRKADERLLARADLVTEMREVKHYYAVGVAARKGIEN